MTKRTLPETGPNGVAARASRRATEIIAMVKLVEATVAMPAGEERRQMMRNVEALIDQMQRTPV